ncbi:alpha-hydroxy-acid oxidizing protein [Cumulibacter manganitolerans]|uniref:alpha-hydroxy-acid oxidizing protein n=1 Tax=Cumulibacter manganitolerans TaxID=1884992 RepID=UPI0012980401|nr:alpha-hydroxy-acid oxidizing protein [Cumulibacter manganitolerans]
MAFGDYQMEIYQAGLAGQQPRFPMDYAALERKASEALPPWILSYVAGGAGDEQTQRANVSAFDRWGIMPRMMRAATKRDLGVDLAGVRLPTPLLMAPVGVLGICTQDLHGDLAAARAAARTGVPLIGSTLMQDPLEDVAAALGDTPGFYQLYTPNDRELAESLVRRAERAGYRGIVVTADTWVTGWRPRDLSTANFPQLRGYCLSNYFTDEVFRARLAVAPEEDPAAAVGLFGRVFGQSLSWEDLAWLRELTDLPLMLKGLCDPADVRRAVDLGVDVVYCSNHGGRQANGGLSALQLLPDVVAAAGEVPVVFDSGVRSGTHVAKAIAMGATAVAIGRPYAWAAAVGGEDAIVHLLRSVLAEADLLMAVDGYSSLAELREAGVRAATH